MKITEAGRSITVPGPRGPFTPGERHHYVQGVRDALQAVQTGHGAMLEAALLFDLSREDVLARVWAIEPAQTGEMSPEG
jgi:hypothetical protein